MKKTRKSKQTIINAHIPVELIRQILDNPDNLGLCHALVSAIVEAERVRKPEGIAAELDTAGLQPEDTVEVYQMISRAEKCARRMKERREKRLARREKRMQKLDMFLCDNVPVSLPELYASGIFTPEQKRMISAILNPDGQTTPILTPEQLRAIFDPQLKSYDEYLCETNHGYATMPPASFFLRDRW